MQMYVIERMVERGLRLQEWSGDCMENLSGNLDLPTDICEWVSPATLSSWVQEETARLNGGATHTEVQEALLKVLAFAYCREIFDSEEILRLCDSESELRELSKGTVFTLEHLRSVRHNNRGLLISLTVRLLTRTVAQKCDLAVSDFPPELKRRLHENAVQRLDNAILLDRFV
jgi:hypothetical protein